MFCVAASSFDKTLVLSSSANSVALSRRDRLRDKGMRRTGPVTSFAVVNGPLQYRGKRGYRVHHTRLFRSRVHAIETYLVFHVIWSSGNGSTVVEIH